MIFIHVEKNLSYALAQRKICTWFMGSTSNEGDQCIAHILQNPGTVCKFSIFGKLMV